jgi:hypothetical protein
MELVPGFERSLEISKGQDVICHFLEMAAQGNLLVSSALPIFSN